MNYGVKRTCCHFIWECPAYATSLWEINPLREECLFVEETWILAYENHMSVLFMITFFLCCHYHGNSTATWWCENSTLCKGEHPERREWSSTWIHEPGDVVHTEWTSLSNFCVHCLYGLCYVLSSLSVCIYGFYMLFHVILLTSIEEKIV